ncbi:MAG: ABC transporter permease [Bifidobacteriaceae bacterium]|jgi:peptide/nickel transport system permease protein|nr:ABC transporter permease [Bifidobacteriaceae bacterium]
MSAPAETSVTDQSDVVLAVAASSPSADAAVAPAALGSSRRYRNVRDTVLKWSAGVHWDLVFALPILAIVALAAIAPGALTSGDPLDANPRESHLPPGPEHLAGTDLLGRDVLTRIIYGTRYSVLIGLGASTLGVLLGLLVGLGAAVGPRWLDRVISRFVDVVAAFPGLLLAMFLITFTGRGAGNLVLALGVGALPQYARLIRANAFVTLGSGYVEQAKTFGLTSRRIVWRHVLPNALGALPIMITIGLGGAIIGSSALSFLGLGPQPPAAEWGLLLAESRTYLRQAWWGAVFPGVALTSVVVAATVLGQNLQRRYERRDR